MFDKVLCTYKNDVMADVFRKVLMTCSQMVEDRGYVIEHTVSAAELDRIMEKDQADPVIVARSEQFGVLHVVFHTEDKVGVKTIRALNVNIENGDVSRVILVSNEGPTPFTRKELGDHSAIECFQFKNLIMNITRCNICPAHRMLSEAEAEEVSRKFNITSDKWPKIHRRDPVVRYFDWPVNSIIAIDRVFGGGPSTYYRIVVP